MTLNRLTSQEANSLIPRVKEKSSSMLIVMKINPLYFFLSFACGILWVYAVTPPPEVIVKFPSPYNAGSVTYKDKSGSCYKYKAKTVDCHKTKWKPQPIYEDYRNRKISL